MSLKLVALHLLREINITLAILSRRKNGGAFMSNKKTVTDSITKEVVCYKCKGSVHYLNQCPLLKKTANKCVFNVVFINGKFNKTEWYVDSGASAQMTVNKDWIKKNMNLSPCLPEIVVANESKVSVDCSGDVNIVWDLKCHITVKNVLCVPSLTTNLLSVSELIRNGNNVVFKEKHCYIYDGSVALVAIADLTDGVYKLRLQSPSYELAASAVTGRLWHRRLAHINSQDMNKMKNGILDGLSYDGSFDITKSECTTCCEGKQMRLPFSHVGERSTETCHGIHSDLCGPMEATEHILVGFGEDVKGYRSYNPTKNNIITSKDVIVMEGETGDIATTSEETIWIPDEERTQESLETPEVSVEQESSISVGETCVLEVDDQCDSSSDSSVYTDGEDALHESPPSKVRVQEVQTTSVPEPKHCVKAKRQRKQPEQYGFSNLCESSTVPASEEISISEALEGPEKEQWSCAMLTSYSHLRTMRRGSLSKTLVMCLS
ncbi:Retrovirus-related Pol polyprotein from transposon TNT 1-94 [Eumeta japonica]|uniref:Retrovirus-related Pol polyprotein from transposon TNT 1-94 n=1 Tax=Eumeta variegata TaxID=151549 RepID=A0A4C1VTM8_EUMVA|nr:Retrovirus-related Pol polyprotein from transposon TNT 1-94 [Eumeta japonica]